MMCRKWPSPESCVVNANGGLVETAGAAERRVDRLAAAADHAGACRGRWRPATLPGGPASRVDPPGVTKADAGQVVREGLAGAAIAAAVAVAQAPVVGHVHDPAVLAADVRRRDGRARARS